jgi:prepilin-type N-terminal cleavage/methylation domain-containing protein
MKTNTITHKKGFTLIELLVVIAIVGVLSTVILAALTEARERGKIVRAQAELKQITEAIVVAQGEQGGKPLLTFAPASNCVHCTCQVYGYESSQCLDHWKTALSQIEAATNGLVTGLSKFERNPWGTAYILDGNQGEQGAGTCSNVDGLYVDGKTIPGLQPIPLAPSCP